MTSPLNSAIPPAATCRRCARVVVISSTPPSPKSSQYSPGHASKNARSSTAITTLTILGWFPSPSYSAEALCGICFGAPSILTKTFGGDASGRCLKVACSGGLMLPASRSHRQSLSGHFLEGARVVADPCQSRLTPTASPRPTAK